MTLSFMMFLGVINVLVGLYTDHDAATISGFILMSTARICRAIEQLGEE